MDKRNFLMYACIHTDSNIELGKIHHLWDLPTADVVEAAVFLHEVTLEIHYLHRFCSRGNYDPPDTHCDICIKMSHIKINLLDVERHWLPSVECYAFFEVASNYCPCVAEIPLRKCVSTLEEIYLPILP